MRTALLPAGGDPFLIAYWLRHFRAWADQVDTLRLAVCDQPDSGIRAYIRDCAAEFGSKVILSFHPRTDHGVMIGRLVGDAEGGLVMLCEDDAYVRNPSRVGEAFARIERGETDIVACPRGSGTPELVSAANNAYGELVAPNGECGPFFWPCFYFGWRSDLLATNLIFGGKRWSGAEEAMGVTFTQEQAADTFGWTSLQLRAKGLRVHVEAQYRAQRDLMADWPDAPWFHVGSLSAGYRSYLTAGDIRHEDRLAHMHAVRGDTHDWAKRLSWWQRVVGSGAELRELRDEYRAGIAEWMREAAIGQDAVDAWTRGFDALVNW